MKIRVRQIPGVLKADAGPSLRRELAVAAGQIGILYRTTVKTAIMQTKPFPPVNDGNLVGGIDFVQLAPLRVRVQPSMETSPYAVVQELGRRPNRPGPPLAPILRWVQQKTGLTGKAAQQRAFLVARKLHRRGMGGRFFFRRARASAAARRAAVEIIRRAVSRWRRVA